MRKILIATTNSGKFKEITTELKDLPFEFLHLKDVGMATDEPDEPYDTTWQNAEHKARYYGTKSKLLTIAEDTGLFVQALQGKPGVHAKRWGVNTADRIHKILTELVGKRGSKRAAYFETHACVYDPSTGMSTTFTGRVNGTITEKNNQKSRPGMDYDSIFYYPPKKKLFADMDALEKNLISHRGQTTISIKVFLQRYYSFEQIVVPVSIIVKDRKMLMTLRRDTRKTLNNKWEFPGGGVENGEEVEKALLRESKEETGYALQIQERLPKILSISNTSRESGYQVFLIGYVCTIRSGRFQTQDNETHGHGWFTYAESLKQPLLPLNKKLIQQHKHILKKYID